MPDKPASLPRLKATRQGAFFHRSNISSLAQNFDHTLSDRLFYVCRDYQNLHARPRRGNHALAAPVGRLVDLYAQPRGTVGYPLA